MEREEERDRESGGDLNRERERDEEGGICRVYCRLPTPNVSREAGRVEGW